MRNESEEALKKGKYREQVEGQEPELQKEQITEQKRAEEREND